MTRRNSRGFSLLELMVTLSFALIMAGVTFLTLMPMFNKSHVDSAYATTLEVMRDTRNLAIAQSHEYLVVFAPQGAGGAPATLTVQYQPPASLGVVPPVQLVNTYSLPLDVNFQVKAGFPANTPDNYGTGITAIDFGYGPNQATGGNTIVFGPDGGSYDTLGDYNGGVVYLTQTSDPTVYSSRAVTVFGATGRIRGWRLYNQGGATWVQQ